MFGKKKEDVVDYSSQPQMGYPQQPHQQFQYPQQYKQQSQSRSQIDNPYSPYQNVQPTQIQQQQALETPQYIGQPTNFTPYLAPPEDKRTGRKKLMAIIVIIIIVIAAISVVAVSLLGDEGDNGDDSTSVRINASNPKRTSIGWEILLSMVAGWNPKLKDISFELQDQLGVRIYEAYITNADPTELYSKEGDIYAIPSGTGDVKDSVTGKTITQDSSINDYQNCYMVYQDADYNYKLTPGDKIYIFRDFDNDGNNDIVSEDNFLIILNDKTILKKRIL